MSQEKPIKSSAFHNILDMMHVLLEGISWKASSHTFPPLHPQIHIWDFYGEAAPESFHMISWWRSGPVAIFHGRCWHASLSPRHPPLYALAPSDVLAHVDSGSAHSDPDDLFSSIQTKVTGLFLPGVTYCTSSHRALLETLQLYMSLKALHYGFCMCKWKLEIPWKILSSTYSDLSWDDNTFENDRNM